MEKAVSNATPNESSSQESLSSPETVLEIRRRELASRGEAVFKIEPLR